MTKFILFLFQHYLVVCLAANFSSNSVVPDQEFATHSTTDVQAQSEQPAALPLLFTVKLTNTGKEPISYWAALGGKYPSAKWFKARITDAQGKSQQVEMVNDYIETGSGGRRQISSGESVTFPALIPPLPEGVFTIQVREGKSARVKVKNDRELTQKAADQLIARIAVGDSFAQYVINKYPIKRVVEGLLEQLTSDDPQAAYFAAATLSRVPELPDNATEQIRKAVTKHIDAAKQKRVFNTGIFFELGYLASRIGTDDALEAVLTLAQTKELGEEAISALGGFKQEKALQQLRLFLADQDEKLQFRAAQRLAEKKDLAALDALLTIAHDPKNRWRMYSFQSLLKYPDDQRVESAIKSGLDDTDRQVSQSAEFALRQLANQKKKKP